MAAQRTHTRETIAALLRANPRAVERAVVVLYDRQTRDEKLAGDTRHLNGRGFSCFHARRGSRYARWVLSGERLTGYHLVRARGIAQRYVGQLLDEARERAERSTCETTCLGCGAPKPAGGPCPSGACGR